MHKLISEILNIEFKISTNKLMKNTVKDDYIEFTQNSQNGLIIAL